MSASRSSLPAARRSRVAGRVGAAGHGTLNRRRASIKSAAGSWPDGSLGLAPAAEASRAGFDRKSYARRSPPRSGLAPRVGPPLRGGSVRGLGTRRMAIAARTLIYRPLFTPCGAAPMTPLPLLHMQPSNHARRDREPRRSRQAVDRAAEEASLTGMRRNDA